MIQDKRVLYRAEKDKSLATPLEPQPDEIEKLYQLYYRIKSAIGARCPELDYLDALYLFDEEEAKRIQCDGQCTHFKDGTTTIGILKDILVDEEYTVLVLLHEIAHLRIPTQHHHRFHKYLDSLIQEYNEKYDRCIQNDYISLQERIKNGIKQYMH